MTLAFLGTGQVTGSGILPKRRETGKIIWARIRYQEPFQSVNVQKRFVTPLPPWECPQEHGRYSAGSYTVIQ
jgi:hypothetical protein